MAALLSKISGQIAQVYADRTSGDTTAAEFRALMQAETWFTSSEALDIGLVDAILAPSAVDDIPADADEPVAADFDLSVFDFNLSPTTTNPEPAPEPVSTFDPADLFSAIREAVK